MNPEEILKNAKEEVEAFHHWFVNKVEPFARPAYPLETDSWGKELELIRYRIDKPDQLRIALVGTTGAGKSTFLNAVLGQEILPVGVMQPCTSFVTSITHSPESGYSIMVKFCTWEEFENDLKSLIKALQPGETDEGGDGRAESKRLIDAARKRAQAVFGDNALDESDLPDLSYDQLPEPVKDIFRAGPSQMKVFQDAKPMLTELRQLVHGDNCLWPLVKEVNISGPYPCLAGGLEIVDLPGLNDPNEARVEVTREYLRTSPFVWILFSMVRGLTDDIHKILQEEKLLRFLVLSGAYNSLSLVGTKADDIDNDAAPQLGLPEDCERDVLIQTYREKTVSEVRKQLEIMVRDLATRGEEGETLERLLEVACQVRVHTTSASAYCKLKKIGRLRRDYGIENEWDTGISGIHEHLAEITKEAGAVFNIQNALRRLDQLGEEIEYFFRSKASSASAELEEAHAHFQTEHQSFTNEIQNAQQRVNIQLELYRKHFMEKMDPLLEASVQGVNRVIEGWHAIHWATLRAIVQRNGIFKSPSTGRSYDFNEDLAEPLLAQLPVSWEKYFTDDLGHVTSEFVIRVTESVKNFSDKIRLIAELLFHTADDRMEQQLEWFRSKINALADEAKREIASAVRERRGELAANMSMVARNRMQSGYDQAKEESGPGMRRRILGILEPTALDAARPIYDTIKSDLLEGLKDLELIIIGMFRKLKHEAQEQARIVAHNANIGIDEAAIAPEIVDILRSKPKRSRR